MLRLGDYYVQSANGKTLQICEFGTINNPQSEANGASVVTCRCEATGRLLTFTREYFTSGAFRRVRTTGEYQAAVECARESAAAESIGSASTRSEGAEDERAPQFLV